MVITAMFLRGLIQKPVSPTINIETPKAIPGIIPFKPYLYPSSALAIHVAIPNSVAAKLAIPR